MKKVKKKYPKIKRIIAPSPNELVKDPYYENNILTFFQKSIRPTHMLDSSDLYSQKQLVQSSPVTQYAKRFHVSERIQNLAIPRPTIRKQSLIPRGLQTLQNDRKRRAVNQDEELLKINKTISGTKIGALSSLLILEEVEADLRNKTTRQIVSFDKIKHMDSQVGDDVLELEKQYSLRESKSKMKNLENKSHLQMRAKRKGSVASSILGILQVQQPFVDKYKEYHMLLMQKNKYYKPKTFSLDYKNEWKN